MNDRIALLKILSEVMEEIDNEYGHGVSENIDLIIRNHKNGGARQTVIRLSWHDYHSEHQFLTNNLSLVTDFENTKNDYRYFFEQFMEGRNRFFYRHGERINQKQETLAD